MHRTVLCLLIMLAGPTTWACNIPVFRYALERWQSDPIEIIVLHDNVLSEAHEKFVRKLERQSADFGGAANVTIARVNVNQGAAASPEHFDIWHRMQPESKIVLPVIVVHGTGSRGRPIRHWQGSIDDAISAGLLSSPARVQVNTRLLAGDSIVWLMLKSPDEQKNRQIRQLLEKNFEALSVGVQLPEGVGLPGSELYSEVPLLLRFSIVEVERDDPQERYLNHLLSHVYSSADDQGDQPLLVPVFGRARALEVIPAGELEPGLIEDLTIFLCGACSCQVKNMNPGFDLISSAAWETELFGEGEVPADNPLHQANPAARQSPVLLGIPPGRK